MPCTILRVTLLTVPGSFSMSTFLTWLLKDASVTELVMRILSLENITGPRYLILYFAYVVVFILGIIKLSEFLSL